MTNKIVYSEGTKFPNTRLTYLNDVFSTGSRKALFRCECGNVTEIKIGNVKTLHTVSCGCYKSEQSIKRFTTHGSTNTPEYEVWSLMKRRINNPNDPNYNRYGGRGLDICSEWENSFEEFLNHMGPRPSSNHSIEQKDNNQGYYPNNCHWATKTEQIRNRSNTVEITYQGITKPLIEWCSLYGLSYDTLYQRLRNGWCVEKALTTKLHNTGNRESV